MASPILELEHLKVAVGEKVICEDVNLVINEGESHVLLGPNGSGKSSLMNAIMGIDPFRIVGGTVRFKGQDISELDIAERAQAGIGMAFQHPPRVEGVTVRKLIHAIQKDAELEAQGKKLALTPLLDREINVGFSGGELKRWEVLKLGLQAPQLCLFDEPESGVDFEHVHVVGEAVRELLERPMSDGGRRAGLIITHTGFILDHLTDARAHLMINGKIVESGDAQGMIQSIRRHGYQTV